ncbi:MAG: hypothetical protein AAF340_12105 [Pseudomonadota bacterium]
MLIELLGLPGSGKSTLIKALVPALRKAGLSARRADKLAGLESTDPAAPRYLKRGADRTTLYRTLAFRRDHPALMDHVERTLDLSASDTFLFSWTSNLYAASREHAHIVDVAFLDEGFAHRGVSAHLDADDALYHDYLSLIPLPDLILHLCPPPRMAFRRAIHRRADKSFSKRKVQAKLGDRFVFRTRHRLIETGLDALKARGAQVIDVNTAAEIEACVADVLPKLIALRSTLEAQKTAAE